MEVSSPTGYFYENVFRKISKKPMHLGSPNLTLKYSTMSHGIRFILRSEGQGHELQGRCQLAGVGFALL